MGADLRIVVQPHNRAATVANARLQGLHIDRTALDSRARKAEAPHADPVAEMDEIARRQMTEIVACLVAFAVIMAVVAVVAQ